MNIPQYSVNVCLAVSYIVLEYFLYPVWVLCQIIHSKEYYLIDNTTRQEPAEMRMLSLSRVLMLHANYAR
jgi:hypothetical protein